MSGYAVTQATNLNWELHVMRTSKTHLNYVVLQIYNTVHMSCFADTKPKVVDGVYKKLNQNDWFDYATDFILR